MNKKRMEYVYHLVGVIKETKKANNKTKIGLKLIVNISNHKSISLIQVWKDKLENQQIWTDLENDNFLGKKYIFYCQNWMGHYRLINWEKLSLNHYDK